MSIVKRLMTSLRTKINAHIITRDIYSNTKLISVQQMQLNCLDFEKTVQTFITKLSVKTEQASEHMTSKSNNNIISHRKSPEILPQVRLISPY